MLLPSIISASRCSDTALVVDAQGGSSQAMATLVRRHLGRVQAFAQMLLGPDAEVDDVVQETFTQVVRSINKLKSPLAFGSWLFAIVGGTAAKTLRHRRLLMRYGLGGCDPPPGKLENVIAHTISPEVAADLPTVLGALEKIPARSREAFLLRHVQGLRLQEIAEQTKASISTVKRRLGIAQEVLDALCRDRADPVDCYRYRSSFCEVARSR